MLSIGKVNQRLLPIRNRNKKLRKVVMEVKKEVRRNNSRKEQAANPSNKKSQNQKRVKVNHKDQTQNQMILWVGLKRNYHSNNKQKSKINLPIYSLSTQQDQKTMQNQWQKFMKMTKVIIKLYKFTLRNSKAVKRKWQSILINLSKVLIFNLLMTDLYVET